MRFWDTSAIVPLCVDEETSTQMRALARADEAIVVWWATRVECVSAMARRQREGDLSEEGLRQLQALLALLSGSWSEILPHEQLRELALRLVTVHPLRAADALQLAAALVWCDGDPNQHGFVSLDERLRTAATHEGFLVFP